MPSYSNNYSKWDALELSDDSDIEGHPNVDHKSLVAWKQRDIHEKREARKLRIEQFEGTIATNEALLPRLQAVAKGLAEGGSAYFSQTISRLKEQPSPEKPPHAENITYDAMVLNLLNLVFDEVVQQKGVPVDDKDRLSKELSAHFEDHLSKFIKLNEEAKVGLAEDLAEQKKHITSDDLHVGFDSKYVPPKKEPAPVPAITHKAKPKASETVIETLNSPSSSSAVATSSSSVSKPPTKSDAAELFDDDDSDDDDDIDIPHMTPQLTAFSQIPVGAFESSFEFLQRSAENRNIIFTEGAVDALLLEGFNAETNGKRKYAKQCVHQGLMIQYCEKLGRDGIGMFFKKMIAGQKQAVKVFEDDVEQTYAMIKRRVAATKEENEKIKAQGGVEQIQLVAENPDTVISFDVPDGPPPADLRLEGPETEGLDIEEVRRALQGRWEIFQSFDPKFQRALKSNSLEQVNKVLGKMPVEEAEQIVELLQVAGILQFAEGGIRDETGKDKAKISEA